MNQALTHLLRMLALALLASCAAPSDTGSVQFAVSVPQALSSSISRVSVTSSAADFPSVTVDLVSSNGVWSGFLGNIPAGTNRSFHAQAFDASGTRLFEGTASGVTISAEITSLIALTLQSVDAPPPFLNAAPLIDSLVASSTSSSVTAGTSLSLVATAHDPNPGDTLTYAWSSTAGTFSSASSASTSWTAPASTGIQTLTFTVTDPGGLSSRVSLSVNVTPRPALGTAQFSLSFNSHPLISLLNASPTRLAVGQTVSVSALASDGDGDTLTYAWSASCAGTWVNASSSSAEFTPSALPAGTCNNCRLAVSVSDGRSGQTTGTLALCVSNTSTTNHLNPIILSASGSSGMATPGQVLTYEVAASDPEGSALSFSWYADSGVLGTPANSTSTSRITWTAPSCVTNSAPLTINVAVANAFNLMAYQRFAVTGLPICPRWALTGAMASPRYIHTATLLPNGKVLISGGYTGSSALAKTEVYDPASGTWSAAAPMASPRYAHSATLLSNGKVLVAGGYSGSSVLATAEVYDPASGTWSATGSMTSPRATHRTTLLPNGKVLVVGGYSGSSLLATAEVYDPTSGTWSATGSMSSSRGGFTATLLLTGKVLVSGGGGSSILATTEVYDPTSGTWSAAAPLATPRAWHTATRLPDGKVLIASGQTAGRFLATAEVYDPASNSWSTTGSMADPHNNQTATLLSNGKVLVAGGGGYSTEVYDPASSTWSPIVYMSTGRENHTATLLPNGKVLVSGGSYVTTLNTAELYTP